MNRRTFLLMQWRSNRGWSTVIVNSFQRTVSQPNPKSHRSITDISQHQISVNNRHQSTPDIGQQHQSTPDIGQQHRSTPDIGQQQALVNTRYRSTPDISQHQTQVRNRHLASTRESQQQLAPVLTLTGIKQREKGLWTKESGYRV